MKNNGRRTYKRGDVVYFDHLHIHPRHIKYDSDPDEAGRTWCRVEGKARRMLILRQCRLLIPDTAQCTEEPSGTNLCVWYRVETRGEGYWVVSLQSKKPPGKFIPCPNLVEDGKVSFVELAPVCYPAESVCHRPNKPVHTVEKQLFEYIETLIGLRELGLPDNYRA